MPVRVAVTLIDFVPVFCKIIIESCGLQLGRVKSMKCVRLKKPTESTVQTSTTVLIESDAGRTTLVCIVSSAVLTPGVVPVKVTLIVKGDPGNTSNGKPP